MPSPPSPPMESAEQNVPFQPQVDSSQENIPSPPVENNNISEKGKGRKKTVLKKIETEAKLKVTFTKRRDGIFRKTSEITTLCGAEAAIIIFSPTNKVYSFGSPSVGAVTTRFHRHTTLGIAGKNQIPAEQINQNVRQGKPELTGLRRNLEEEMKRKKEHNRPKKLLRKPNLDEFKLEELSDFRDFILNLIQAFQSKLQIENV